MKALPSLALAAALAASLLPSTAEARFGKKSGGSAPAGSPTPTSGTHPAAPAGSSPSSRGPGGYGGGPGPSYRRGFPYYYGGYYAPYYYDPGFYGYGYYGYGDGYAPYYYGPPPAGIPPPLVASRLPPPPTLALGFDGQPLVSSGGGTSYGVSLALEGRRWGFNGLFTGIVLPSDSAPGEYDNLRMLDAHITYALLSGGRGRLRLEAGFNSVFAQDVTVLGPDGGVSVTFDLLGPLGVEGSTHFTPWRHRRFDAGGGLRLAFGPLALRGGWRYLLLDDNGVLGDGSRNIDHFYGPYFGVSVAL